MDEQFVTYTIAKILKAIGFNQPCLRVYSKFGKLKSGKTPFFQNFALIPEACSAPLWQQAIDWLAKNHNICISEKPTAHPFTFELYINTKHVTGFESDSRQKALMEAVKKAVDFLVEDKRNKK